MNLRTLWIRLALLECAMESIEIRKGRCFDEQLAR